MSFAKEGDRTRVVGVQEEGNIARVTILGVGISAVNLPRAVARLEAWISARERTYVCITPVAGVMACQRDAGLLHIFNASGMTTPDGMPIVWLLRGLGHRNVGRVYGPDLMRAACRRSETAGWRHYFYGGLPGVAARLAARLSQEHPGLVVAGVGTPPLNWQAEEEDMAGVAAINAARPDVVWLGMSTPKQERWMATHRPELQASVLVGVGAAFDFLSGAKPQAPVWMQRSGLEWLFRLVTEPRRLWRRYLVDNPMFVILVTMQLLGLRRSEPPRG